MRPASIRPGRRCQAVYPDPGGLRVRRRLQRRGQHLPARRIGRRQHGLLADGEDPLCAHRHRDGLGQGQTRGGHRPPIRFLVVRCDRLRHNAGHLGPKALKALRRRRKKS